MCTGSKRIEDFKAIGDQYEIYKAFEASSNYGLNGVFRKYRFMPGVNKAKRSSTSHRAHGFCAFATKEEAIDYRGQDEWVILRCLGRGPILKMNGDRSTAVVFKEITIFHVDYATAVLAATKE